jgi:hypothetical protein
MYPGNFFDHLEDDIDFPDADSKSDWNWISNTDWCYLVPTDIDPPMTPSDVFGLEDSERLIDPFLLNETFDLPESKENHL